MGVKGRRQPRYRRAESESQQWVWQTDEWSES
jgi:hypothetical protein